MSTPDQDAIRHHLESTTEKPRQLSRRLFITIAAEFLGITIVDAALDHLPTKLVFRYLTDQHFRELVHSRSPAQLIQDFGEVRESQAEVARTFDLEPQGDDLVEGWMNNVFANVHIYNARDTAHTGFSRNHYMALCEVSQVAVVDNRAGQAFTTVTNPFATLPSSATMGEVGGNVPSLYSAYSLEKETREYFDQYGQNEGGRSQDRGAVIVLNDGSVVVVNNEVAARYSVGSNCRAIESCSFTLDSSNPADISSFMGEETPSGKLVATSPTFGACMCTYYFDDGTFATYLLSSYQRTDLHTGTVDGVMGREAFYSPIELYGMFQTLTHSFSKPVSKFIMQVPDPGTQSYAYTSEQITQTDVSRNQQNSRLYNTQQPLPQQRTLGSDVAYGEPITREYVLAAFKQS